MMMMIYAVKMMIMRDHTQFKGKGSLPESKIHSYLPQKFIVHHQLRVQLKIRHNLALKCGTRTPHITSQFLHHHLVLFRTKKYHGKTVELRDHIFLFMSKRKPVTSKTAQGVEVRLVLFLMRDGFRQGAMANRELRKCLMI